MPRMANGREVLKGRREVFFFSKGFVPERAKQIYV
jgi:hypothetical protein